MTMPSETKPKSRQIAAVLHSRCVGCGCCEKVCPKNAVRVRGGVYAVVDAERCIGCGLCVKVCPASVITREVRT